MNLAQTLCFNIIPHNCTNILKNRTFVFLCSKPCFYSLAPRIHFSTLAKWALMFLESWDTCASGLTIWRLATKKANYRRFAGSQLQRYSWDVRCTFEPNVAHMIAQVFPFNCVHHKYSHYLFHQSRWNHILCEPTSDFPPDFWKPKHRKSKNYEICLNRLSYQIISLQLLDKLSVRHSGPKRTFKQPPGLWLKQRSSHIF